MSQTGYKKSRVNEQPIQTAIIEYLESVGAEVFNTCTSTYSSKGTPDLIVCYKGRFIAIEVKKPGKTPTKLQKLRIRNINIAGGIAIYTDNIKEVEELINDISRI